jgi:hypothetical protein
LGGVILSRGMMSIILHSKIIFFLPNLEELIVFFC